MGVAVLTASNAAWAWSVTGGQTVITVEAIGGGGGGGGEGGYPGAGGGGKAGGYARTNTITKGAETTLNIIVGVGGGGGNAADAGQGVWNGGPGGQSKVIQGATTRLLASGGYGGGGEIVDGASGAGSTLRYGTPIGDVVYSGGNGADGVYSSYSGGGGGTAGPSGVGGSASGATAGAHGGGNFLNGVDYCSLGAAGRTSTENDGLAGPGVGAGGSGGYTLDNTNHNGGAGYRGVVVITWVDLDTVPDAPTIGIATKTGDSTATVSFTAPQDDGGSTILHYHAYPSSGAGTGTLTQAGSGTIDVTGLTAGTAYTFTVKATNAIGESAASAASNQIVTVNVPVFMHHYKLLRG